MSSLVGFLWFENLYCINNYLRFFSWSFCLVTITQTKYTPWTANSSQMMLMFVNLVFCIVAQTRQKKWSLTLPPRGSNPGSLDLNFDSNHWAMFPIRACSTWDIGAFFPPHLIWALPWYNFRGWLGIKRIQISIYILSEPTTLAQSRGGRGKKVVARTRIPICSLSSWAFTTIHS